jgi:hypothetical protein
VPSARPSIAPSSDVRTGLTSSNEPLTFELPIVAGEQISELMRYCSATRGDLCKALLIVLIVGQREMLNNSGNGLVVAFGEPVSGK